MHSFPFKGRQIFLKFLLYFRFAVFNDPKETPVVSVTSGCNCSITTLPINYDDTSLHYGYYTMKPENE